MKVLLLGSDGTLGTSLQGVDHAGYDLVPWTVENCDLTDLPSITAHLAEESPDAIINASAYTDVDGAEKNEGLATLINGEAVGQIAMYCASHGTPLIHFSTDYVFSGSTMVGYTEQDVPSPINAYGRSKLKGETLIAESRCPYLCIRTSRLFGKSSAVQGKRNFIDTILERAQRHTTISVVDDERTSPTFADDLARSTFELLSSAARGIYHRTNDGDCTWFEFAKEVFSIVQLPVTLIPVRGSAFARAARRPACSTLKTTKAPPLRTWKESLKEYVSINTETL